MHSLRRWLISTSGLLVTTRQVGKKCAGKTNFISSHGEEADDSFGRKLLKQTSSKMRSRNNLQSSENTATFMLDGTTIRV